MATAIHFNTFGGNPVACAVGGAVLEVQLNTSWTKVLGWNAYTFGNWDDIRFCHESAIFLWILHWVEALRGQIQDGEPWQRRLEFSAYTPWQNVMNAPWLQTLINTADTNTKN